MMSRLMFSWLFVSLVEWATSDRTLSNVFYEQLVIPDDTTLKVFLYPGKVFTWFYLLQKDVQTLSMTVTPCTTPVAWELECRNSSQTGKVEVEVDRSAESLVARAEREQRNRTVSPASSGLYTVRLAAAQMGWVELYATFLGPPAQLWPRGRIVARSRAARGHVYIRWSRTTVDPEMTEYVLVVHPGRQEIHTLCQARELEKTSRENLPASAPPSPNQIIMENTGHRTSWLVRGLELKHNYRVELFAVNTATNFSYKFAEMPKLSYSRPKPRPLTDGLPVTGELKPHEPTLLYRYKVRKEDMRMLEVGITACGEGTVIAEVRKRGSGIEDEKSVKGYGVLTVPRPVFGAVYIIKLKLPSGNRPASAQVVVRGNGLEEPVLPEPADVHEFRGLRGCNEVTLGWVPVDGEATYCLRASQSRKGDILNREPDQCAVEQQLNSLGYSVLQCSNFHSTDRKVVSERLTNLKPGKQYDIQLSVKKGKSKRLSYKLLRVRTKSRCT